MRTLVVAGVVSTVASLAFLAPAEAATGLAQVSGAKGCYVDVTAEQAGTCTKVKSLQSTVSGAISPDGLSFYAAVQGPVISPRDEPVAGAAGVTTFARDRQTGALTWESCVTNDGTRGPDGTFGECGDGNALRAISGLAVTSDGKTVVTTGGYGRVFNFTNPNSSVSVFARDVQGGALSQTGCFSEYTHLTRCAFGTVLLWPSDVTVSPDGRDVYVAAYKDDAIARFERTTSGGLVQQECISNDGSDGACTKGYALRGPVRIVLSADGRSAYVLGDAASSVAVLARDPETGVLRETSCLLSGEHGACQPGAGVGSLFDIALNSSGTALYALGSNGLRVFDRDPATGALTRGACLTPSQGGDEGGPAAGCQTVDDFSPGGGALGASGERVFVFSPGASWDPGTDDEESTAGYTVDTLWAFRHESNGGLTPDGCLASAPEDTSEHYTGKCTSGLDVGNVTRMVASDGPLYLLGDRISLVDSGAALAAHTVSVRNGLGQVTLTCTRTASRRCTGAVRLRVPGRGHHHGHVSSARRFSLRGGRSVTLAIAIPLDGLAARTGAMVLNQTGLREIRTPIVIRRAAPQRR
jgi:6-phosphogluconolactonase (cycloisomerase 2 family)